MNKITVNELKHVSTLTDEAIQKLLNDTEFTIDNKDAFVKRVKELGLQKWMNLFEAHYSSNNGNAGTWLFASRKQSPKSSNEAIQADAVVIIPLLKDGRQKKLVTIKEYRIPLGDYEYGFPAGLYNPEETAEAVAKRELKEETGLKLKKVLYVSPPSVSSAGLSDESVVYVVCECTGEVNTSENEGTEDISVNILDLEGIKALRSSGNKISAKSLPFMLMFEGMKKIAWPKQLKIESPKKKKTVEPEVTLMPDESQT